MPTIYGIDYLVVGRVRAGSSNIYRELLCSRQPSIQQINLLYVLSKHVSHIIDLDDLCYHLKCSANAIRIIATHCRKILHHDWTIESVTNQGLRLLYIGGDLADADFTYLEFNPEILVRRKPSHQIHGKLVRRITFTEKKPRARFTTVSLDEYKKINPVTIPPIQTGRVRARL